MSVWQQTLHIFKKDVRMLRWEIAGLAVLNLFLILQWADSWGGDVLGGGAIFYYLSGRVTGVGLSGVIGSAITAITVYVAVWTLVIARLLHSEPLVGDSHFWLTRPYSRLALPLAKGLFIAAFLLLPLLVAQVVTVVLSGLPPAPGALLANQLYLAALLCLPAAAVAALTRSLWLFVPAAFVAAGATGLAWVVSESVAGGSMLQLLGAALIGVLSAGVLAAQYRSRRVVRNGVSYGAAWAAVLLLMIALPRDAALSLEFALAGTPDPALSFAIGPPPARTAAPAQPPIGADGGTVGQPLAAAASVPPLGARERRVELPIQVLGAEPGDLFVGRANVTLRGPSGRSYSGTYLSGSDPATLVLNLRGGAAAGFENEPVSLRAELIVKQFRRLASVEVPRDGTTVWLAGHEQCRMTSSPERPEIQIRAAWGVVCRHALSLAPWQANALSYWAEEYSADPSYEGHTREYRTALAFIDPADASQVNLVRRVDDVMPSLTVTLRERIAYRRVTLDAENLRLADYVVQ